MMLFDGFCDSSNVDDTVISFSMLNVVGGDGELSGSDHDEEKRNEEKDVLLHDGARDFVIGGCQRKWNVSCVMGVERRLTS